MNRSTWASGSGYVPSDSIGFCVAMTRNGTGTRWVCRPMVTCCSCMASSNALCTFAGARLISSASSRLVNTGPSSTWNSPVRWWKTRVPMMSAGTRSGVNCTRWNCPPTAPASDFTARVFASPGTPSTRMCPRASSAMSSRSSSTSWPTMVFLTS